MMTELVKLKPIPADPDVEEVECVRILWSRVLQRALFDYVILRDSKQHTVKDRREFQAVSRWLFQCSDLNNSLSNICEILGISVENVRYAARVMTRDDVRKIEFRDREGSMNPIEFLRSAISDGKA